jgi:signal peptidase I
MKRLQVLRRLEGRPVAASDRPATPPARHPRLGRLLRVASSLALVAVLALVALVDGGIVGTPWYRFVSVEGGSMAPAIGRGDLILVAPAPAKVEPGMILVLRVGGQVVTHRVVAVNPDGTLVTRGDANSVDDAWGGQQVTVEGQYLATVPVLGNVLHVGSTSEASFADGGQGRHDDHGRPLPAAGALPARRLRLRRHRGAALPAAHGPRLGERAPSRRTARCPSRSTPTRARDRTGRTPGRRPSSTTRASRSMRATRRARSRCRSRPATARPTSTPARSASTASTARLPHYPDIVVPQPLLAWSNGPSTKPKAASPLDPSDPSAPTQTPTQTPNRPAHAHRDT